MEDSSLNLQDIPQPLRTAVCGEELAVVVNRRRVLKSAELAVQKASFSFDRPVKVVFFLVRMQWMKAVRNVNFSGEIYCGRCRANDY